MCDVRVDKRSCDVLKKLIRDTSSLIFLIINSVRILKRHKSGMSITDDNRQRDHVVDCT